MAGDDSPRFRIGELSRRVGLKPELIRAWERRYGLVRPARTAGGLRLYSRADEVRLRRTQALIDDGLSAAEAASAVREEGVAGAPTAAGPNLLDRDRTRLEEALGRFDADEANAALDRLLASFVLDTVLSEVILPYLHDLGERWAAGAATVAQEHFASNLLRARLGALARGWESGTGPLALLACARREQHDLPLLAFGLALRSRGWRIAYLGANTPARSLLEAAERLEPRLVVISSVLRARFKSMAEEIADLAAQRQVMLAGAGASASLAESLGCAWLGEGPTVAADRVTTRPRAA